MTAGPDTGFGGYAGSPFRNRARQGPGVTLQVVDFTVWEANGKADATGTITLQSDPVPGDCYWLAQRLTIDSTSAYVGRLDLYEGESPAPVRRRDWGLLAPGWPHIRAYTPAILVRSNRPVLAVITSVAAGDAASLTLAYAVVKRTTA